MSNFYNNNCGLKEISKSNLQEINGGVTTAEVLDALVKVIEAVFQLDKLNPERK